MWNKSSILIVTLIFSVEKKQFILEDELFQRQLPLVTCVVVTKVPDWPVEC